MEQKRIAFIGAGNMAGAIMGGLVASGYPAELITASNRSEGKLETLAEEYGIHTTTDNLKAADSADVVVLGVKPNIMEKVVKELAHLNDGKRLFISIAAGVTLAHFEAWFGAAVPLIRTMPNTPSLVGLGMTGLYASDSTNKDDKAISDMLMRAVGKTAWVKTEAELDHIIAVAGSAPAYFFLFMEAMEAKAIALGFDAVTARELVQQTASGASEMVRMRDMPIRELRRQVTSPGGTTAKAIESFQGAGLDRLVSDAMDAAIQRAREMAKEL
ncbi:pyrroline-5-carboxylate reductase [Gallaecimonas xiamenensis]|uniref:Pyrroline-5-carboxylate reductase n=1 Tax=Gallaecimonas xiamenensis 3-C-1 TaxID=745411 RepID=K2KEI9_9GAMM|nr:pyrroline-5-carboxylate reductase [Gallaecimonas xiamenensis]EKE75700.1 pyrroline-5-carboxylate reductase [Gallaecimonas xiamenensis 3-C-1]